MRNDASLYTGLNSSTATKLERVAIKEKARKEDKTQKRAKLLPAAEVFSDEIDKEMNRVIMEQINSIDTSTGKDEFQAVTASLNLYKESMKTLKSRINNIMRTKDA